MAQVGTLSPAEQQVIQQMRALGKASPEWKLTLTMHQRSQGSYLQLEPTPYLKVLMTPDVFLAVE